MTEPRYCSRCAREIEPGDAYCGGCGTAVPHLTETEAPKGGYHDPVTGAWVRDEAAVAEAKRKLYATLPLTFIALLVLIYFIFG